MSKKATTPMPSTGPEVRAFLEGIDKKNPDSADVNKMRQWLNENPAVAEKMGNLCIISRNHLLERSFTHNSTREFIMGHLRHMRDELGYDDASELERSLIQHVLMCWTRLHDCEFRYNTMMGSNPTFAQGAYWEKKLSANQRRYLKACETLARVKRLLVQPTKPVSPAYTMLLKQQLGVK